MSYPIIRIGKHTFVDFENKCSSPASEFIFEEVYKMIKSETKASKDCKNWGEFKKKRPDVLAGSGYLTLKDHVQKIGLESILIGHFYNVCPMQFKEVYFDVFDFDMKNKSSLVIAMGLISEELILLDKLGSTLLIAFRSQEIDTFNRVKTFHLDLGNKYFIYDYQKIYNTH